MTDRVAPKPIETPQRLGQSAEAEKRPGPSPASAHSTGPAPPFEYGEDPPQSDLPDAVGRGSPRDGPGRG